MATQTKTAQATVVLVDENGKTRRKFKRVVRNVNKQNVNWTGEVKLLGEEVQVTRHRNASQWRVVG